MQQSIDKHVLFYSKHCEYSLEAMSIINVNGLRSRFYLVNVEDFASSLPPFVTSVPLIFNKAHEILVDDDLFLYLNSLIPVQKRPAAVQKQQQAQDADDEEENTAEDELNPYQFGDDNFSFIDDENPKVKDKKSFSFIDENNTRANRVPDRMDDRQQNGERPPDPIDTRSSDKDLSTILDRYKAERDFD
jgi:hypothetical protein